MEDDQTLPADDRPEAAPATAFGPVDPACYEFGGEVARGSFGRVVSARDRRLDRSVAIKLLHERGGALEARFRREAMVTARLPHPSIVPVYEVGQLPTGELFYAMKLISGKSLRDVISTATSLDERISLLPHVIAAADAIAYAHSRQIIHRDLKPANIMVGPFGETVVIDWGLAKPLPDPDVEPTQPASLSDSAELTRAGAVVGTPAYMPPEQALGDTLDPRADVYSLGAILYHVLCGRPPYQGESDAVVMQVRSGPPPSLEKVEPGTPSELAAVVRRAMERAIERRYPSAREMADDLRRFQTGQLVGAHRYSPLVLARRWLARHPGVLALALLAVLVAVATGLFGRERKAAATRLRLAADLSAQVEREKARLDVDYRSPLHDTRPAVAEVNREIRDIRSQLAAADPVRGLGLYSLARTHMALRQFAAARDELEEALRLKDHPPEVAAALGRTLAEQYRVAMTDLLLLPEKKRKEQTPELQKTLRDPALRLLRTPDGGSLLVHGVVALLEERLDEALTLAQKAAAADPTEYDGLLLEGDAHLARAEKEHAHGNAAEAKKNMERARAAYRAAADIGRSDPFVHQRACRLGYLQMAVEGIASQLEKPLIDDALAACERARTANPDLADVLLDEAHVYEWISDDDFAHGRDPRPGVEHGMHLIEEALRLDPNVKDVHMRAAATLMKLNDWEWNHGIDRRPTLARIRAHLDASLRQQPTAAAYHTLGLADYREAEDRADRGEDPEAPARSAIEAGKRAIAIEERMITHYAVGRSHLLLSAWQLEHGRDPRPEIASARKHLDRALEMNPNFPVVMKCRAEADRQEAGFEWAHHRDAHALLKQALAEDDRGIQANPQRSELYLDRAITLEMDAALLVEEGQDASSLLKTANAAVDKSLSIDNDDYNPYKKRADLKLLEARTSRAPAQAFAEAERALAELERRNANAPVLAFVRAEVALWKARWEIANHRDPSQTIVDGLAAIEKAVRARPELATATRGALEWERARSTHDAAQRALAARDLDEALRLNPLLERLYQPLRDQIAGQH
jgi:hypothetical protein